MPNFTASYRDGGEILKPKEKKLVPESQGVVLDRPVRRSTRSFHTGSPAAAFRNSGFSAVFLPPTSSAHENTHEDSHKFANEISSTYLYVLPGKLEKRFLCIAREF